MQPQESVNWVSVLAFLQKQHTQSTIREKQWALERTLLTDRIARLQAELDADRVMIADLINRIRLLEIALTEAKAGRGLEQPGSREADWQKVQSLVDKYQLDSKIKDEGAESFLKQILSQVGLDAKQVLPFSDIGRLDEELSFPNRQKPVLYVEAGATNAHLDGIRAIYLSSSKDFIVTASQDCLVKLWDYSSLASSRTEHVDPLKVYRQHTGPLFALAAQPSPFNPEETIMCTGGSEGLIRYWKIINKNIEGSPWAPVATWGCCDSYENTAIWDLGLSANNLLASISDRQVNLYELTDSEKYTLKQEYKEKQFKPTSVEWISAEAFVQGCSNAPRAMIWDLNAQVKQKYLYDIEKGDPPEKHQVNKICFNKALKIITLGCEDGALRLFSTNFSRMVRKIQLNASVSSVKMVKQWQVACSTHAGSISLWDLRNYQQIKQYSQVHLTKYDEGVLCLAAQTGRFYSGGADGVVKMFS